LKFKEFLTKYTIQNDFLPAAGLVGNIVSNYYFAALWKKTFQQIETLWKYCPNFKPFVTFSFSYGFKLISCLKQWLIIKTLKRSFMVKKGQKTAFLALRASVLKVACKEISTTLHDFHSNWSKFTGVFHKHVIYATTKTIKRNCTCCLFYDGTFDNIVYKFVLLAWTRHQAIAIFRNLKSKKWKISA